MKTEVVTLMGTGRIGTSVGLALKRAFPDLTIIGHDADHGLAKEAQALGAVDKAERNLLAAATPADILVLTTTISDLKVTLKNIGGDVKEHALILDMSLLKKTGLKWAEAHVERGHYIGVKPIFTAELLADGRSGLEAATPDLFRNSVFCLMPSPHADPQAVETAVNVGHVLGATPYFLDAAEFDGLVQSVETLPRLMAAALFNTVHQATGWRDILRFAGLPFALSTLSLENSDEIAYLAQDNKAATMYWLDSFIAQLEEVRRWIYHENAEALSAMLENLSIERERWLLERKKNDWLEGAHPDVEAPSLGQQMFGGFLSGRRAAKDE